MFFFCCFFNVKAHGRRVEISSCVNLHVTRASVHIVVTSKWVKLTTPPQPPLCPLTASLTSGTGSHFLFNLLQALRAAAFTSSRTADATASVNPAEHLTFDVTHTHKESGDGSNVVVGATRAGGHGGEGGTLITPFSSAASLTTN